MRRPFPHSVRPRETAAPGKAGKGEETLAFRSFLSRVLAAGLLVAMAVPASHSRPVTAAESRAAFRMEKLHPKLRATLQSTTPGALHTVVIKGHARPRPEAAGFHGEAAVEALKAAAARSQVPIVSHLKARGATVVNQFWLINAVVARVDTATLQSLTSLPEVAVVHDNFQIKAPPIKRSVSVTADGDLTWGVEKVEASRVWNELGFTGTGVRVAVLDTGVDISHPDLAGKMHTDNPGDPTYPGGWMEFDAEGNLVSSEPQDTAGHGTHVSGTVLGGNASGTAIGVAPGATLMHGMVLPGGGGSFAQVVAGMQWAVEPTDASGNPAGQRAHIASMSFGAEGLRPEVVEPIRNMYFAGVLPIAAMGNCGHNCVGSPGAVYEAFGIGASDIDDNIANFSSGAVIDKSGWGSAPDEWPEQWIKPDISGPGVSVLSAVPGGGYEQWDGTSMATPHVAGAAALMLSANPSLTPDQVLATLSESSFFDPRYGEERPNTRYGWGRINAYEATVRIAFRSGIEGVVQDAATGAPLDQAIVRVDGGQQSAKTRPDGSYSLSLRPGTYTLTVERFGYQTATVGPVQVAEEQKTVANASLTPLPMGTLRGTVRFDRSGHGIPGVSVRVNDVPIRIEARTGADGAYELHLPVGTYGLTVNGFGFAKETAEGLAVTDGGTTVHDVTLQALPRVAVIGDMDNILSRFLTEQGFLAESAWFDIRHTIGDYHLVIVNQPGRASAEEFMGLVDAAHAAGVGMIFTSGYWTGWGIDLLRDFYGDPATVNFNWFMDGLRAEVAAAHDELLPGKAVGDEFTLIACCAESNWFDGYSGQVLTTLKNDEAGLLGAGVAVKQNANNRHVLLASMGVTYWQGPAQWSEEGRQLFLNAVRWAARPEGSGHKFVVWNLEANPETVLWNETVTATVGVKNIGDGAGAQDVRLTVDGEPNGIETVSLGPNEHTMVSFPIQREKVGSYKVQVGHLTDTFRVRPPRVQVTAQTIAIPPSGKGRKRDPGEPAIPLAGARVDLVQNGAVINRGTLDQSGTLIFDSTASRADYTIVVHHTSYGYNTPRHYLLTMPVHVEADTAFSFAPQAADAVQLTAALTAKSPSHHGSLFLANGATGNAAFELPSGPMVLSPGDYQIAYVMAYDVPGAQWAYSSDWESRSLAAGAHTYSFGGNLALDLSDVRGQQAPDVRADWAVKDAYGHVLNGIHQVAADSFGANRTRVADVAAWPATVTAAATGEVKPVLTLTNPAGAIVRTGTVGWTERPKDFTLDAATVLVGSYGLAMQADTGPYMGMLQDAATLVLPARSLSRTLVMAGDTFQVTVEFDAGQSGEIALTESLPAGFSITKQSAKPNARFSGSTWTWRSGYRPGDTVRVTYTVRVGNDVAPGTYSLTGTVTQGGVGRLVAGPQQIQVVR